MTTAVFQRGMISLLLSICTLQAAPPVFTTQPPARAAQYTGETLSLTAAATGTGPITYQWRKNGVDVAGATTAVLGFTPLSLGQEGDYQVIATNGSGSTTSVSSDLSVIACPDLATFIKPPGEVSRYSASGNAVIGINQGRYFNRPMYVNNNDTFVLTGDKPMAKVGSGGSLHGKFFVGITRGSTTRWLHDFTTIKSSFQPSLTTSLVTDPAFSGLSVKLEMATLTGITAFTARCTASGALSGDKLVWAYGGSGEPGGDLHRSLDPYPRGNAALLNESFTPAEANGNSVQIRSGALTGAFTVLPSSGSSNYIFGRCSAASYRIVDAGAWGNPASLVASSASSRPLACGEISLSTSPLTTWSFTRMSSLPATLPADSEPGAAFAKSLLRSAELCSRIIIDCPEPRLNAAAAFAAGGIDGAWYGNKGVHGGMSWNQPFVGWRSTIGYTMLGWQDRVKTAVDYYLARQVTTSSNTSTNTQNNGTIPATDSRFYGKGYIAEDQHFYEMQTQYFDQILQDWRSRPNDDSAHEAKLRVALELHLERGRECYDPDNDGTYESIVNTWPTDSIWFSGGGCVDQTAYMYRGHRFARDLAQRAGDNTNVAVHQAQMTKIHTALFAKLWVTPGGHPGLFHEQGGAGRLINNPWLYSLCLPIEAGMLTSEQAATTLHYSEYGLENFPMTTGGRRVITSNFTPSIWSVRPLWPGDNYMLSRSYFDSGFSRDGWDVLRGAFLHSGFNDLVPGDCSALIGGTDFGDCMNPFVTSLVDGFFGYKPDFPNGKVRIAPQFPADWTQASIKTPDFRLRYSRSGNATTLVVRVQRDTPVEVDIPVRASGISNVMVNGVSVAHTTLPGFGHSVVRIAASATAGVNSTIMVTTSDTLAEVEPVSVEGISGSAVNLSVPGATLVSFSDPLGALQGAAIASGVITGNLSSNLGHHRIFAHVTVGGLPQTRIFNLHTLKNPNTPSPTLAAVPAGATWATVDMSTHLTANITSIYQQNYASPRPSTVSTRIATDGYSPWTFSFWGINKPTIEINQVAGLVDPGNAGRILTPQGVPFRWGGASNNVAFTSLWDNWPDLVTVPVNRSADSAWFLICGSTTVMQNRIANAVLRLKYADNVEETLELTPPYNYWNLSPIRGLQIVDQFGADDYTADSESYMIPKPWPMTVQLGTNCRAMVLNRKLRPGIALQSVTLEALSQEVVVGLMGVSLMNPVQASSNLQITDPQPARAAVGKSVSFTTTISGNGPFTIQWFKTGNPGALSNSQTLEIPNITAADYSSYFVTVSNGSQTVTSAAAALLDKSPLAGKITWNPAQNITGSAGKAVSTYDYANGATLATTNGTNDVATAGTLKYAVNFAGVIYRGWPTRSTINGNAFETWRQVPVQNGISLALSGFVSDADIIGGTAASAAYGIGPRAGNGDVPQSILDFCHYGNSGSSTLTLSGLSDSKRYLVQIWVQDSRSGFGTRTQLLDGQTRLNFGSGGGNGGIGQWATGIFYPDGGNQNIVLTSTGNFDNATQFNLLQVRELPPLPPYDEWSSGLNGYFPGETNPAISGPDADPDGDGMKNYREYAFGLIPNNGASCNPITLPFNHGTGTFSYLRRSPAVSGLDFTIHTSPTLQVWTWDSSAMQTVTSAIGAVETVRVAVSPALLSNPKLFVQVHAQ